VVVAAVTIAALMGAAPAHAASYRYWSYWWVQDGTWTFATAGPASSIPADGAVEGWHFGITSESGGDPPGIDAAGAFDQACGSTPAEPGSKRVALAIDPGEPDDAPDGEAPGSASLSCVVIEEDSNGYQVLRSQAQVRTEAGLICAIAGYPAVGCADIVEARTAAPSAAAAGQQGPDAPTAANAGRGDSTGANALPLVVAGLAIGALAGFAWRRRRRP
jgi:LPXTG-motif cell wall-anchored protein